MDYKGLSKQALGKWGENLAAEYLQQAGLIIMQQNYRCPKGEIDIIARDQKCLVFVEVRTRTSDLRGYAQESIDYKKLKTLTKLGAYYLVEHGYKQWPELRFDILAINFRDEVPEVTWIKGIS